MSATICPCRPTRRPALPAHRPQWRYAAGATRASASRLSARSRLSSSGAPCRQRGIVPAVGDEGHGAMVWIHDDDIVDHLVGARQARAVPASASRAAQAAFPVAQHRRRQVEPGRQRLVVFAKRRIGCPVPDPRAIAPATDTQPRLPSRLPPASQQQSGPSPMPANNDCRHTQATLQLC